jgi:hypothetical protein
VVSNRVVDDRPQARIEILRHPPRGGAVEALDPGMEWPAGMYSLSHVALPFPEHDPLYGSGGGGREVTLGNLALRGEVRAIRISAASMLRQRWNPFFGWLDRRVLAFAGLGGGGR